MPDVANVHSPAQLGMVLVGTPVQAGAEPIQTTAAGVLASWSVNMTSSPAAILTVSAGDPEPGVAQHGQSGSTQFWFTSSFTSEAVASAGTAAGAPSRATKAKSNDARGLTVSAPFLSSSHSPGAGAPAS